MKYPTWEKYNLTISLEDNLYVGRCKPEHPNSRLLGIVRFHNPMYLKYFRQLSFDEEIIVIRNLVRNGNRTDRYPLMGESEQVCVYKDKSYVYDLIHNDSVIEDVYSFDGSLDNKNIDPIMILPTIDMLGILEDYQNWKSHNKRGK